MFFKGSRYAGVGQLEITDPQGRVMRYKKLRFIPETPGQRTHTVSQGERLDLLAHQYLGDPERFWRICDANRAMWPDDLVSRPGSTILIPSPEG